jgi:hypothetical protein
VVVTGGAVRRAGIVIFSRPLNPFFSAFEGEARRVTPIQANTPRAIRFHFLSFLFVI